jgi:Cdc6-like AAA superfamily ATPase
MNDVVARAASVTDGPSLAWVGITETIRVDFPGRTAVLTAIAGVNKLADVLREPPGLLVLGYTGAGKSAIALEYLARYPRYEDEGQTIVTVLYVVMPDKPTRRSMVAAILKALGDPTFDRGSADALTERLGELLRQCRTRLIIIDEFQHVMDRAQENVAAEAAEWLKTFWYSNRIGVVLFGLEHCYKLFTRKENKQLRRRLSRPIILKPFPWNEDYGVSYALFLRDLRSRSIRESALRGLIGTSMY